jgi:predicted secreted protein
MKQSTLLAFVVLAAGSAITSAQVPDTRPPSVPVVSVSAVASTNVPNDRMYAWLRSESEGPDPARAASEVNAKMAKALARAKAVTGIDASTSGYTSYQVSEPKQTPRWRIAQTLSLEGADFAAMSALVSKLQSEDLLLLSGMNFAVSPAARQKAEDGLTQQAIKTWQQRARNAAQGFGYASWRAGRVAVQTGDHGRPQPMMRATAGAYAAGGAPVAVEGGNTEVTVTVSGEAVLEQPTGASK